MHFDAACPPRGVFGTSGYRAPEVEAAADAAAISLHSDMWSIGVVLLRELLQLR